MPCTRVGRRDSPLGEMGKGKYLWGERRMKVFKGELFYHDCRPKSRTVGASTCLAEQSER